MLSCGVLLMIVGAIGFRGLPAISWHFFTEQIRLVGAAGGIFYNLVGTLILITTALVVCTPVALGVALLCGVYGRHSRWRDRFMVLLYLLNGVPSILFGILGLIASCLREVSRLGQVVAVRRNPARRDDSAHRHHRAD